MRFQIALRNVFRNGRRTLLNIVMIAGGISAIVIFYGFCHHLIWKIQEVAINSQYGHLQIASEKTWNLSPKDSPKDRLIRLEGATIGKIRSHPEVAYVSGRLTFFGLLSSGDYSTSARAVAFDPSVESNMLSTLRILEGRSFRKDSKFEILVGSGLIKQVGVPVGASVTIAGYTVDGAINAIDSEVVGIFQTQLEDFDNSAFFIPLSGAQRLLDTDEVERYVIQLKQTEQTRPLLASVSRETPQGMRARPWFELSKMYNDLVGYFGVQNKIINWILMTLVLLGILNTVGMAVSERTGEIGTVRALGDTRGDVVLQFLLEGLLLGIAGGVAGCITAIGLAHFVNSLQIPLLTPGSSVPQIIWVDLVPRAFLQAFLLTCFVSMLASAIPAIRASRIKIVDALRHNI